MKLSILLFRYYKKNHGFYFQLKNARLLNAKIRNDYLVFKVFQNIKWKLNYFKISVCSV